MIIRFHGVVFGLLVTCVACGKVGDPLPPFIRIPQPVNDLAVRQIGHDLVLTWTNPGKNIDDSAATDLARIRIRRGDSILATVNINGPAQPQSYTIPIGSLSAGQQTFTVQAETMRGKLSDVSKLTSITPVEVPGKVTDIRAVTDQRRIMLTWNRPAEHPELAEMYVVSRSDGFDAPEMVSETRYEDSRYQTGKNYEYEVTAVRQNSGVMIPGIGPETIMVIAEDRVAPKIPSELDISPAGTGAFLTWDANIETDLAGYRVFRSERPEAGFKQITDRLITTNALFDPGYQPGLYYAVSAVDELGNESARSTPFRAP